MVNKTKTLKYVLPREVLFILLTLLFLFFFSGWSLEMILPFQVILCTQPQSTEFTSLQIEIFLVHWWSIHTLLSNKTFLWFYSIFHRRTLLAYTNKCLHEAERKFSSWCFHASRNGAYDWYEGHSVQVNVCLYNFFHFPELRKTL